MKDHEYKDIMFYFILIGIRLLFMLSEHGLFINTEIIGMFVLHYLVFGLIFFVLHIRRLKTRRLVAVGIFVVSFGLETYFTNIDAFFVFFPVFLFLIRQSALLEATENSNRGVIYSVIWMAFLFVVPIYLIIDLFKVQEHSSYALYFSSIVNFEMNWSFFRYFILLFLLFLWIVRTSKAKKGGKQIRNEKSRFSVSHEQREGYLLAMASFLITMVFFALEGTLYRTIPVFDLWVCSLVFLFFHKDPVAGGAVVVARTKATRFLRLKQM